MSRNPKIMVFKLKELIYTGIFIVLGILLIILFISMFKSGKNDKPSASAGEVNAEVVNAKITNNSDSNTVDASNNSTEPSSAKSDSGSGRNAEQKYNPGVYTSSLMLNNSSLEIEVCVDLNSIQSVSIKNMDAAIETMYPLMSECVEDLESQIVESQSLENITYTDDCRYTYMILLDAVRQSLNKAIV